MRRQTAAALDAAGDQGRSFRLDPFLLPARVDYVPGARAGQMPQTALVSAEMVIIRRMTGAGVPLYVTVPVRAYRGVLLTAATGEAERVCLRLDHANADLTIPLFEAEDTDDVIADWQAWGRALSRPLLVQDADGGVFEPYERLGGVILKRPKARRVNTFFAQRRPRFLCRRRVGGEPGGVVFEETEIIARDVAQ